MLHHQLLHAQSVESERIALVGSNGESITYPILKKQLDEYAQFFQEHEPYCANQRVALLLPQCPSTLVVALAAMSVTTCVPLNPEYTPSEVEHYLNVMSIDVLVTVNTLLQPLHSSLSNTLKTIDIVLLESQGDDSMLHRLVSHTRANRLKNDAHTQRSHVPSNDERYALILHSSGSTGTPKLIPLTERNIRYSTHALIESLSLSPDDRVLSVLPMFHIGAIVDLFLAPLASGGCIVFADRMNVPTMSPAMVAHGVTWFQAVPAILKEWLMFETQQATDGLSLRFIRSVSSPLSEDLQNQLEAHCRIPVVQIYGMSETTGLIASNPVSLDLRRLHSVGQVKSGKVMIQKKNQEDAYGEVLVSGEHVMPHYLQNNEGCWLEQEQTRWLKTGDIGYMDDDFLYLVGRSKELINRGGEKLSPVEIDAQLIQIKGIKEAASFAVPHPSLHEDVAAAVVLEQGVELTKQSIRTALTNHLAAYKLPKQLYIVNTLPKNASGKVQRYQLTELLSHNRSNQPPIDGDVEYIVAELWSQILGVDVLHAHADFFELGGDSLKALSFFIQLEQRLNIDDASGISLFDYPTVRSFSEQLAQYLKTQKIRVSPIATQLPHDVHKKLRRYLSVWRGERTFENALMVGRNITGKNIPIVWCVQSAEEFNTACREFTADDHPVYGLRSLFKVRDRDQRDNQQLAQHYKETVDYVLRGQPCIVGGFCEGGKVAFALAQKLSAEGVYVPLLCLHDQLVNEPYNGRVMLSLSSFHGERYDHLGDLDKAFEQYTEILAHKDYEVRHHDFYRYPMIESVFADMRKHIAHVINNDGAFNDAYTMPKSNDTAHQIGRLTAYQEVLSVKIKHAKYAFWRANVPVRLEIHNQSQKRVNLQSQTLLLRWFTLDGRYKGLAQKRILMDDLPSGERVIITFDIHLPDLRGIKWYKLQTAIVEQDEHESLCVLSSSSILFIR